RCLWNTRIGGRYIMRRILSCLMAVLLSLGVMAAAPQQGQAQYYASDAPGFVYSNPSAVYMASTTYVHTSPAVVYMPSRSYYYTPVYSDEPYYLVRRHYFGPPIYGVAYQPYYPATNEYYYTLKQAPLWALVARSF